LFGFIKGVLHVVGAAAVVLGASSVPPAMDGADRDRHLLCQSAAGFGAGLEALPLLFVGGCFLLVVALECTCMRVAFLVSWSIPRRLPHAPQFTLPYVYNDMKLDT